MSDILPKAILKYRKHPSILAIKRKIKSGPVFTFNHITKKEVIKEIKNLDASKASQEDDIPARIIKENSDIFSNFIYQSFNNMINACIFPTSPKLANISKIYERCLFKPISNYFENIFSKCQCGFRQGLSAQYYLISMTEIFYMRFVFNYE